MRKIFILVPAALPAGPIKGAWALANELATQRSVTVVTLKSGDAYVGALDDRVRRISLAGESSFRAKVAAYRALLREAGGRSSIASISMCLSADAVNLFCRDVAVTCSSVRGNLLVNYRMDYGLSGVPVAMAHLWSLRKLDHVVAMTEAMAWQVRRYTGADVPVIGNFVDERELERFRAERPQGGMLRFVFVGSLTHRKQPLLAIRALQEIVSGGISARLEVLGDGVLRKEVELSAAALGLSEQVQVHGFKANPYEILATAHAMVLPSLSEGVPRAALEALHLGVPCVLREADGNGELILPGINGSLFRKDADLADAMLAAAAHSGAGVSLLPPEFRQQVAARRFLDLVEGGQ